jgi:hypothetical protein
MTLVSNRDTYLLEEENLILTCNKFKTTVTWTEEWFRLTITELTRRFNDENKWKHFAFELHCFRLQISYKLNYENSSHVACNFSA